LLLPKLPQNYILTSKVVKCDSKIIISLCSVSIYNTPCRVGTSFMTIYLNLSLLTWLFSTDFQLYLSLTVSFSTFLYSIYLFELDIPFLIRQTKHGTLDIRKKPQGQRWFWFFCVFVFLINFIVSMFYK